MCATAHVRWECTDKIQCYLWTAKTRVTPLQKMTIPRVEMQAAVLGVRLSSSIQKNSIWEFEKIYHIVDSECTLAIIKKDTSALREFMGNRVAEILESTSIEQWHHVKSTDNIADLGTRNNATVDDISEKSDWQNGGPWMRLPIEDWPTNTSSCEKIPEEEILNKMFSGLAQHEIDEASFSYEKYRGKNYLFIVKLTARLLKI